MSIIPLTIRLDSGTMAALRRLATERRTSPPELAAGLLSRAIHYPTHAPAQIGAPAERPEPKFYVTYSRLVPLPYPDAADSGNPPDFRRDQRLPVYAFIAEAGRLALVVTDPDGRFWTVPGYDALLTSYDTPEASEPAPDNAEDAARYVLRYLTGEGPGDRLREAVIALYEAVPIDRRNAMSWTTIEAIVAVLDRTRAQEAADTEASYGDGR